MHLYVLVTSYKIRTIDVITYGIFTCILWIIIQTHLNTKGRQVIDDLGQIPIFLYKQAKFVSILKFFSLKSGVDLNNFFHRLVLFR